MISLFLFLFVGPMALFATFGYVTNTLFFVSVLYFYIPLHHVAKA
jgi:hypothetical protein